MILYHWTQPRYLLGIIVHGGLTPTEPYDGLEFRTIGKSVVWLTARDTRKPAPDDIEHIRAHSALYKADRGQNWSERMFGLPEDVRLTVKFNSSNNKKLKRYWPWIQQFSAVNPETGEAREIAKAIAAHTFPSCKRDHYVHLGRIPLAQIEMPPLTAALAIVGLEYNLEGASDDESRAHLQEQIDKLKAAPPDVIVNPRVERADEEVA
jgi:hypothetical protein